MAASGLDDLNFTMKEITGSGSTSDETFTASVVPESSSTLSLSEDNKLVCVEYPGIISNVDKMLESIGGIQGMSKTYADPSRRLELRFRPQDPFCHPVCGNRYPSTNLLLRMKRRVRKGNPKETQISMDILGVIGTTYKFQGMADFQYLAVHSAKDGSHTSLYDKIILRKPENNEFFEQPVPLFLPPPIFSRLDSAVDYNYRPEIQHKEGHCPPTVSRDNLIGLSRARRPHNAIFLTFNDQNIPTEPLEAAKVNWKRVCVHPSDIKAEEQLKEMFESRPIWSGYAVKANLDLHPDKLKLLLPIMAYYMVTGPWRSLWVRFGYDPCKTPEAKKYQVLDFRIRCSTKHGYTINDMPVKAKRSTFNYTLPITLNKAVPQAANVTDLPPEGPAGGRSANITRYQLKDSSYIFRDGTLPPHRQMFYQLCDLDVESIRNVISRNDGQEEECDERDGWCLSHTSDDLRDIMSSMIKQVIRAKRSAPYSSGPESSITRRKTTESGEDDEEENEEDEFHPSEGSDNEMQTEMLDYM
ncbi:general transcription factor 3C polypeptide 5-like isoform X1 [Oncorhynchus keta]|uniref:general transcription factor 3C polypeptide 5-like isoform X1 n=1 Tax=Oncorhynchus keta TaxID=8018 RepID=UPI0015F9C158|nr:general transcription factor 3C polypeptide 5-like isoform X1 [Oncorhynchus keta]